MTYFRIVKRIFTAVLVLAGLTYLTFKFITHLQNDVFAQEVKTILNHCSTAEEIHRKMFGCYIVDVDELAKQSGAIDPRMKLYLDGRSMPENMRAMISSEKMPFVSNDSYRILLVAKRRADSAEVIWFVEPNRGPTELH